MKKTLLQKGATAPNFKLTDQKGQVFSLADALAQGPIVLIFYPGDNTPGCSIQLTQFSEAAAAFERAGVKIAGINPRSLESHAAFAEKLKLPFPLLSDAGGKTSRAYGALLPIPKLKIVRRTVYGVDKNRVIRYSRRGMPKPSDVLRTILKGTP